jgi:hypothetical protein
MIAGALLLLALSYLCAPAQRPRRLSAVPLTANACPVVHSGEEIEFEWNPLFDPEWPVKGVGGVNLFFGREEEFSGSYVEKPEYQLGGPNQTVRITATVNGNYRIAFPVTVQRSFPAGVYHLLHARFVAQIEDDYHGPAPKMMHSPVDEHYCFTLKPALQ